MFFLPFLCKFFQREGGIKKQKQPITPKKIAEIQNIVKRNLKAKKQQNSNPTDLQNPQQNLQNPSNKDSGKRKRKGKKKKNKKQQFNISTVNLASESQPESGNQVGWNSTVNSSTSQGIPVGFRSNLPSNGENMSVSPMNQLQLQNPSTSLLQNPSSTQHQSQNLSTSSWKSPNQTSSTNPPTSSWNKPSSLHDRLQKAIAAGYKASVPDSSTLEQMKALKDATQHKESSWKTPTDSSMNPLTNPTVKIEQLDTEEGPPPFHIAPSSMNQVSSSSMNPNYLPPPSLNSIQLPPPHFQIPPLSINQGPSASFNPSQFPPPLLNLFQFPPPPINVRQLPPPLMIQGSAPLMNQGPGPSMNQGPSLAMSQGPLSPMDHQPSSSTSSVPQSWPQKAYLPNRFSFQPTQTSAVSNSPTIGFMGKAIVEQPPESQSNNMIPQNFNPFNSTSEGYFSFKRFPPQPVHINEYYKNSEERKEVKVETTWNEKQKEAVSFFCSWKSDNTKVSFYCFFVDF